MADRPFSRNRSRVVRVAGLFAGRDVVYEVQTEEWLNRKTGRYRRVWSARQRGSLGWNAGQSARAALANAAYVRSSRRPQWLTVAAAEAEALIQKEE